VKTGHDLNSNQIDKQSSFEIQKPFESSDSDDAELLMKDKDVLSSSS